MDWELAMRRQAVTEWRDRQIMDARSLLNAHAQAARNAFEAQLSQASMLDSVWDPAGFTNHRIDALMHYHVSGGLADYFKNAAKELVSLDKSFTRLGKVLASGAGIKLPAAAEPRAPSKTDATTSDADLPVADTDSWLVRLRGTVATTASTVANYATETADWLVQDKVGLRDRLRLAATNRISTQWMGDIGEPLPVLAQVIAFIDQVTHEARTMLI